MRSRNINPPSYKSSNLAFEIPKAAITPTMLSGQDWLQYVFARWFYMEDFLLQSGVERVWHFDSDTMLLSNLGYYP